MTAGFPLNVPVSLGNPITPEQPQSITCAELADYRTRHLNEVLRPALTAVVRLIELLMREGLLP